MNRQEAAHILIQNDLHAMIAINGKISNKDKPIFTLGFMLYYATVIINAYEWYKKAGIQLTAPIDFDLLAKLRAKTKLYSSDSAIPLVNQKELMSEILEIEKRYWLNRNSKFIFNILPLPDVGVYAINGHNIGNTLEFAYEYSPFNPDKKPIIEIMNGETGGNSLSYNFGSRIGENIAELSGYSRFDIEKTRKQKKAAIRIGRFDFNYSSNAFLQNNVNGIFAFNLVCRINYLLELLIPLCIDYPMLAFRMMYITFYHLQFDLNELDLSFVHYNMPFRDQSFRNTMAHYSLFGKINDDEINPKVIGLGLFEKFFDKPFETVNSAIINEFKKTRDSLEEYVQIKGNIAYD